MWQRAVRAAYRAYGQDARVIVSRVNGQVVAGVQDVDGEVLYVRVTGPTEDAALAALLHWIQPD